jgi:hypothetical protein
MGAVTVAIKRRNVVGASREVIADVTFSGTYGAGGDTFTNQQFECDANLTIDAIIDCGAAVASATTGYILAPDIPNKKLRLFGGAASGVALAEASVGNQAATVQRVIVRYANPNI